MWVAVSLPYTPQAPLSAWRGPWGGPGNVDESHIMLPEGSQTQIVHYG